MLEHRATRAEARDALLAIGESALEYLDRALADPSVSRTVKRHLPRTISKFPGKMPAQVLLNRLPLEVDEDVQLKILRGVGRMRSDDPSIPIDKPKLVEVAKKTVERAVTVLNWRLTVERMTELDPSTKTDAAALLLKLLEEKELGAMERAFRVLGVIQPQEEFRMIYDGLASSDKKARAGSRELLEHVAPDVIRGGMLAMVDDVPAPERLTNASGFYDPPGRVERIAIEERWARLDESERDDVALDFKLVYAERMREMLRDRRGALRSLASYHIAELGLNELRTDVETAVQSRDSSVLGAINEGALGLFRRPELSGAR